MEYVLFENLKIEFSITFQIYFYADHTKFENFLGESIVIDGLTVIVFIDKNDLLTEKEPYSDRFLDFKWSISRTKI